jgi:hypothetical protein
VPHYRVLGIFQLQVARVTARPVADACAVLLLLTGGAI